MALTGHADDTQLMSAFGGKADIMKTRRNVRFGSKADIGEGAIDVRFTPKSGHWNSAAECPLCAKSGLVHRSNFLLLFDLPVGATNQRKRYARAECLSGFQMERWKNFYRQELQV